jgi:hypothetical protein
MTAPHSDMAGTATRSASHAPAAMTSWQGRLSNHVQSAHRQSP